MPQYVTQMTPTEAKAESKKATEEGLRQVAKALAEVEPEECFAPEEFFAPEECYTPDEDKRHCRKLRYQSTEVLERTVHYMQLDIANMKVELAERMNEIEEVKSRFMVVKSVNDDLAYIGKLGSYLIGIKDLTLEQVKNKLELFMKEDEERHHLCMNTILNVELPEVKAALILALNNKRVLNKYIEEELQNTIKRKEVLHIINLSGMFSLVILILAFIVGLANNIYD